MAAGTHRLPDKTPVATTDSAKRHRYTIDIRRAPCLIKQSQLWRLTGDRQHKVHVFWLSASDPREFSASWPDWLYPRQENPGTYYI